MARRLTERQQRFAEEYIIDLDATKAAIRAGYSERTAGQIGYQLLQNPLVQEAIRGAMDARSKRTQVTADMVIDELRKIGFSDMRKLAEWDSHDVKLIPSKKISDDAAAAICEIGHKDTKFGTEVKLKTHDKVDALKLLAQHTGALDKRADDNVSCLDDYKAALSGEMSEIWADDADDEEPGGDDE